MSGGRRTAGPSVARLVATRVLFRVATDAAYAAPSLDGELVRSRADGRDAALATEIVYGTLRVLPALDARIDAHLRAPEIDPWVRAAMRAAAYQIAHLRVPVHAAVDEAVGLVRRERGARLAGLANAILRKLARARPEAPAPPDALVVPEAVLAALTEGLGSERAEAFLGARTMPPPLGGWVHGRDRADWLRAMTEARPEAELSESTRLPRAFGVRGGGDPRRWPGYADGHFVVQELGAQHVAAAVEAREGERIADLCAGHGGKTMALLEAVGDSGQVVAADLYEARLERLAGELERLGWPRDRVPSHTIDLSVGTGGLDASFDRVLLDAPCTGLGTLHRRPELSLRFDAEDPARMAALQGQLLDRAASLVRPGGWLVYAVCSPTRREGADVAAVFESAHPEFSCILEAPGAGLELEDDGLIRVGPWLDEAVTPDAYQVARWRRV